MICTSSPFSQVQTNPTLRKAMASMWKIFDHDKDGVLKGKELDYFIGCNFKLKHREILPKHRLACAQELNFRLADGIRRYICRKLCWFVSIRWSAE